MKYLFIINFLIIMNLISSTSAVRFSLNGRLICGEYSAFRVLIRLWNEKQEVENLIGEAHTNENGTFFIEEQIESDLEHLVMTIHHDCDDGVKAGRRKFIFQIPDKYFSKTSENRRTFDFGTFNLETRIKHGESRVEDFD